MYRIFFLSFFLGVSQFCSGQVDSLGSEEKLHMILKPSEDGMLLRWAPSSTGLWLRMHRAELVVMRKSWFPGQFNDDVPELISDTLRVWPDEEFENWKDHELVMLSGYCMHAPYESLKANEPSLSLMVDQEEELSNRFSSALFAAERSMDAASAQAMFFKDVSVDLEKRSLYTLRMKVDETLYTASVYYDPEDQYTIVPEISKWSEDEETVVLSWDKVKHENHFSSFHIERSIDNINFKRLTVNPYVHAFDMNLGEEQGDFIYIDSVVNYIPYYYRIVGLDAFGSESKPSPSKRLMGKDKTPPPLPEDMEAVMHLDQFMKVTWGKVSPDVEQIFIKKSDVYDGTYVNYSNLLNKKDTIFFDLAPTLVGSNFYQLCVQDTAQNVDCSSPIYGDLKDTIPPSPPIGLSGKIDSNGVVSISWNRNKEVDIYGYKVFFSNRYDGVYSVLTNQYIGDTSYVDTITLNSLTEDIFYRVVASDIRDNISKFSDFARLVKPDTITPGPSVFTSYRAEGQKILLEWAPSGSHDVKNQLLYRKTVAENSWTLIETFSRRIDRYEDMALSPRQTYQYRIIAKDDAGLESKIVKDIRIKSPLKMKNAEVVLIMLKEDDQLIGKVELVKDDNGIDKVYLYLVKNNVKSTYRVLDGEDLPFTFNAAGEEYVIRVIYNNGEKSSFLAGAQ